MVSEEKNYQLSISLYGEQIKQAFVEASRIKLPQSYKTVNNVVVCGMGGSQLPVDLLKALFNEKISRPVFQLRDYNLPKFVGSKSLVVLSSYSGTTEEVLSVAVQAKKMRSKVIVLTSGGKLALLAKKNNWPMYKFEPINNPSKQPRMGTGYIFGGLLAMFKKTGLLKISQAEINLMVKSASDAYQKYQKNFLVNSLGQKLKNKIPVFVAGEHLAGNLHILANQINESAKQLAVYFPLPELNHHLLEGLTYPASNQQKIFFVFLDSQNYSAKISKRLKITEQVLTRQKIKYQHLSFRASKIAEVMDLVIFGSLLSSVLAKINKVDPNLIPWVNFFKQELKK